MNNMTFKRILKVQPKRKKRGETIVPCKLLHFFNIQQPPFDPDFSVINTFGSRLYFDILCTKANIFQHTFPFITLIGINDMFQCSTSRYRFRADRMFLRTIAQDWSKLFFVMVVHDLFELFFTQARYSSL